jgi:hypothetical protein
MSNVKLQPVLDRIDAFATAISGKSITGIP